MQVLYSGLKRLAGPVFSRMGYSTMSPICLDFAPEVTLNSRYEIIKGLGRGTRSTVWLANDMTKYGLARRVSCD